MAEKDSELLNTVYREIADNLGMEIAASIYEMFKGQQITFPMRFMRPEKVKQLLLKEYNGKNVKELAVRYNYSEKTVRRMLKELCLK